jgi:heme exporter protein C
MKAQRTSFFPVAAIAGLALVVAIGAIFWLAPKRLVQVHEQAIHWNGADTVDIQIPKEGLTSLIRLELMRVNERYKEPAKRQVTRSFHLDGQKNTVTFDGRSDTGLAADPGSYKITLFTANGEADSKVSHRATETVMGYSSKIFYFHVGSAMVFLICFIGCALLSVCYLIMRRSKGYRSMAVSADYLAHAMAEVGVVFSFVVLITGPIWAKPNWGVFWTWEPRLLLTLLTSFLFIGYLVLRNYAGSDDTGRRLSAGIAVIGLPAAYFIHVAVELWGGNHPKVLTGGGLHGSDISTTFAIAVSAISLYASYLISFRFRTHRLRDAVETLFLDLSELEDRPS